MTAIAEAFSAVSPQVNKFPLSPLSHDIQAWKDLGALIDILSSRDHLDVSSDVFIELSESDHAIPVEVRLPVESFQEKVGKEPMLLFLICRADLIAGRRSKDRKIFARHHRAFNRYQHGSRAFGDN